jgi:transcriptional regulator with XRE-family HTH domain
MSRKKGKTGNMTEAGLAGAENATPGASEKRPAHERNPVDVHIGHRIRKRRLTLRMTQTMLAERLGVSFQAVQKWEGGAVRITISLLLRIAWALDVPFSYFLQGLPVDKALGLQVDDGRWLIAGSRSRSARAKAEEWLTLRAIGPLMELPPKVRDEVVSHIRGLLRALAKE